MKGTSSPRTDTETDLKYGKCGDMFIGHSKVTERNFSVAYEIGKEEER